MRSSRLFICLLDSVVEPCQLSRLETFPSLRRIRCLQWNVLDLMKLLGVFIQSETKNRLDFTHNTLFVIALSSGMMIHMFQPQNSIISPAPLNWTEWELCLADLGSHQIPKLQSYFPEHNVSVLRNNVEQDENEQRSGAAEENTSALEFRRIGLICSGCSSEIRKQIMKRYQCVWQTLAPFDRFEVM